MVLISKSLGITFVGEGRKWSKDHVAVEGPAATLTEGPAIHLLPTIYGDDR
jgi:hypothetical protein